MNMLLMIHHYKAMNDCLCDKILVYMLNKDHLCHSGSLIPANAHDCLHATAFFSLQVIMLRWEGLSKHCCPDLISRSHLNVLHVQISCSKHTYYSGMH